MKSCSVTLSQPSAAAVTRPPVGHLTGTLSKQVVLSQMAHLKPTQARPRTPARSALPLTVGLTPQSYPLSESDWSADGEEAGPGPEVSEKPHVDPAVPGRTAHSLPLGPVTIQPKGRSGAANDLPEVTCAARPCFPGVLCEPSASGFRCGRCPPGYVGDGQACRGGARWLL